MKLLFLCFSLFFYWGSFAGSVKFLDLNPEMLDSFRSSAEQNSKSRCHSMFRKNPNFKKWDEAISKEKQAFRDLKLAEQILKGAMKSLQKAKKNQKKWETLLKKASSINSVDVFVKNLNQAEEDTAGAMDEKKLAKEMVQEARLEFKRAKRQRKEAEKAFKKTIPRTSVESFQDSAILSFQEAFNKQ